MSTLRTDFSGAFDTGLFTKAETRGTVTQTGGEILFTFNDNSTGAPDVYVRDVTAADATDNDFVIELSGFGAGNNNSRMFFAALDSSGRGWAFRFAGNTSASGMFVVGTCTTGVGSFSALSSFGNFDNTVNKFLRLRHSSSGGSKVYWDWSTDGSSWTSLQNQATPTMTLSAVKGEFGQYDSYPDMATYKVTNYWAPSLGGGGGSVVARPWILG